MEGDGVTGTMSANQALKFFSGQEALSGIVPAASPLRPDLDIKWHTGDKVRHAKWGEGTIVSVKGEGEETELKIAFPGQGIRPFMQKYAPITRA